MICISPIQENDEGYSVVVDFGYGISQERCFQSIDKLFEMLTMSLESYYAVVLQGWSEMERKHVPRNWHSMADGRLYNLAWLVENGRHDIPQLVKERRVFIDRPIETWTAAVSTKTPKELQEWARGPWAGESYFDVIVDY